MNDISAARSDALDLHQLLQHHPHIEFNIKKETRLFAPKRMSAHRGSIWFAPFAQCTLVPDDPNASTSTTVGICAPPANTSNRSSTSCREAPGMRVSLFMDPDIEQIERAAALGADRVELYTEPYAASFGQTTMSARTGILRLCRPNAPTISPSVSTLGTISASKISVLFVRVSPTSSKSPSATP